MKKNILFGKSIIAILTLLFTFGLTGCKETIDESNFAIKTEETITDFLTNNPDRFSEIKAIFDRVRLSESEDASSITSVLSARGNYTLFAPNNEAIKAHLESLGLTDVSMMSYEQAQLVAYSCVIDNKTNSAYETPDFPTPGTFGLPNFYDRLLTCEEDTLTGKYMINGSSLVEDMDNTKSNGVVHEVSTVIAPSSDLLPDMIKKAANMKVMGYLLDVTGWSNKLIDERDVDYEEESRAETYQLNGVPGTFTVAQRRYLGYTAFVEPDDVYKQEWGIDVKSEMTQADWDAVMNIIEEKCEAIYGVAGKGDYTNEDNAVNRFVAYHFLEGKMAYDRFVHHYNEYGYKYGDNKNPQMRNLTVNVWDYYITVGSHRSLIKVTQLGEQSKDWENPYPLYVNRVSEYNNSRTGNYQEIGTKSEGILISARNGEYDNNAKNGFYFPINKILVYNEEIRNLLGGERIRIDMTTILPEISSNNLRGNEYTSFPKGYFSNIINESADTKLLYLMDAYSPGGGQWNDYQGDEMMFSGLYDFVLRLPPVPKDGTYELRMGVAMNSLRGMAQIYFGEDPNRLQPAGLPYDMRQVVSADNPSIPWVEDTGDEVVDAENDKNLRNQGYLKGPNYFTVTNGQANIPVRERGGGAAAIRRIVLATDMKADKTYYLRFKSALKKLDSQFFMDYLEFAPTVVYNGATPEDIW